MTWQVHAKYRYVKMLCNRYKNNAQRNGISGSRVDQFIDKSSIECAFL